MFRIDSNQVIKISKGDDVKYPMFLNKGTLENPVRYQFNPAKVSAESNIENVSLDSTVFMQKATEAGTYNFKFANGSWILNEQNEVTLSDYGIVIDAEYTCVDNDFINAVYTFADNCEVVFVILQPNQKNKNVAVLTKVFKTDNTIHTKRMVRNDETGKLEEEEEVTDKYDTVNKAGDMILRLQHRDTLFLPEGEYRYVIYAKIIDSDSKPVINEETNEIEPQFIYNTVTNKLPLFIVDDEIDRFWGE